MRQRLPLLLAKNLLTANLTERHARALLKLENDELRLQAITGICGRELNVKQTEDYIDEIIKAEEITQSIPVGDGRASSVPHFEEQHSQLPAISCQMSADQNVRVFAQTIKTAALMLNRGGIQTEVDENQTEGFVEYKIKIAI